MCKGVRVRMVTAALFVMMKNWKQFKCLSVESWHIHTMQNEVNLDLSTLKGCPQDSNLFKKKNEQYETTFINRIYRIRCLKETNLEETGVFYFSLSKSFLLFEFMNIRCFCI